MSKEQGERRKNNYGRHMAVTLNIHKLTTYLLPGWSCRWVHQHGHNAEWQSCSHCKYVCRLKSHLLCDTSVPHNIPTTDAGVRNVARATSAVAEVLEEALHFILLHSWTNVSHHLTTEQKCTIKLYTRCKNWCNKRPSWRCGKCEMKQSGSTHGLDCALAFETISLQ